MTPTSSACSRASLPYRSHLFKVPVHASGEIRHFIGQLWHRRGVAFGELSDAPGEGLRDAIQFALHMSGFIADGLRPNFRDVKFGEKPSQAVTGLKRLDVSQASVSIYLLPLLGVLFSALLLKEKITPAMLAGGALTLAGTILITSADTHGAEEKS